MTLRSFFKLVEIQTKIASVFPFTIGLLFVFYKFGGIHLINTIIFFSSMLIFDLTTTAINNYIDYKKASSQKYRKEKNIIGQQSISEHVVLTTIFTLLFIAITLGIWLVFRTNIVVLLIGILCFCIGIFYTFGPLPISRMPLGEVFSGLTMGFGIVFLTIYVNTFDQGIINLIFHHTQMTLQINYLTLFEILWVSLPCVFTIANIMLANNICDLEEDIANNRFTLPYYIGKKRAVVLFDVLYAAAFLSIITAVIFRFLPAVMLLALIIILPVSKHCRQFNQKQVKTETFVLSVKNMVLVNGTMAALLLITLTIL